MLIPLFLLSLLCISQTSSATTSLRGKCSIECYSRCMQSGSPSAVYCNCPVERAHRPCNSVDVKLAKAPMVPMPSSFSSEYLDAHSIRLQIPLHSEAFVYVFEYTTVSTRADEWYFAGSSATPTVTFTILDPCRDYKFRVIIVLRSSDPVDHLVIYDEKAIRVQLPPFVLTSDQVFAEHPTFNETTDSLKIYVRWTLPRGYSDSDIYGYEAPALYPIQCRTPEDELPQPKIEIVRAGGRLAVTLPLSVLEARCRLWVEVRMLPRCVRLEPFSIQKNIEIDCNRNFDMDICRKEAGPMCMEIQAVSGKRGRATITWLPPPRIPLYYHVRYGPAQIKDNLPHTIWQIATKRDIKADGSVTNLALDVVEDQVYGVQVCAIYSQLHKRPKFGLVRVTPFHCTSCNNTVNHAVDRCGECGKVDKSAVPEKSWKDVVKSRNPIQPHRAEELPSRDLPTRVVPSPTVFRMETDLLVGKEGHPRHSITNISVAQVNTHEADAPIAIERAVEINDLATTSTSTDSSTPTTSTSSTTSTTTTTSTTSRSSTTMDSTRTATEPTELLSTTTESETSTTEEMSATTTSSSEATSEETATEIDEVSTTDDSKVIDVEADLVHPETEQPRATSIVSVDLEEDKQLTASEESEYIAESESNNKRKQISRELEESVRHLEKALDDADLRRKISTDDSTLELSMANQTSSEDDAIFKAASELKNKLESSSAEVRHHERSKKCLLSTGIVCNFGCESPRTCRCPPTTHVLSPDGGCVSRDSFGNTHCLPSSDVNATWDPISMNVMVRSDEAGDHIRSVFGTDRLLVEFGRVVEEKELPNGSWGGPLFNDNRRTRMVAAIEKLVRSGAFVEEPFVFHVNESVNVADESYGIRFCTFNSTRIKDPFERDWDVDTVAMKTGNPVQIVPVSPVHFAYDVRSESVLRSTNDTFWGAFFVVGKIMLLVVLVLVMFVLVYLNCSRIRLLYDRKRTHYFRPYYIDPQVQISTLHPYIQKRAERSGFYQNRTRVI